MEKTTEQCEGAGIGGRTDWRAEAESERSIAARLGVGGDFVRVPQLSRALGISATSIHTQMRRGIFPMPHRRVGRVIVVRLADYVEWLRGGEHSCPRCSVAEPRVAAIGKPHEPPVEARERLALVARGARASRAPETRKEWRARIEREVAESLRRKEPKKMNKGRATVRLKPSGYAGGGDSPRCA